MIRTWWIRLRLATLFGVVFIAALLDDLLYRWQKRRHR